MSKKLYEKITNRIIEKLEEGTAIFQMPFVNGEAKNHLSGKAYRGINQILLDGGEYATFKQIRECGGKVKKGAKSETVIFWKMVEAEDENTGETIKIPLAKQYNVFKIGKDTEGIEPKQESGKYEHEPIEEAERIVRDFENKPRITHESGGAHYTPSTDILNLPPKNDFKEIHRYYSTFFHELVHSTGSKDRLNRPGVAEMDHFGSKQYSKEELVAELGAAMLCGVTGIENLTIDHSASYIQSWISALRNDHSLIVTASQQAQKAVDYILGTEF